MKLEVLRQLFRNLRLWESIFEETGCDFIRGPDGEDYHLADIQYLYEQRKLLSPRQCMTIELHLYDGMTEKDASIAMGISPTNPCAMASNDGLRKIIKMIEAGELPRYKETKPEQQEEEES